MYKAQANMNYENSKRPFTYDKNYIATEVGLTYLMTGVRLRKNKQNPYWSKLLIIVAIT